MSYTEFAVFRRGLPRECRSNMRLAKSIRLKDGITAFPTLTNTHGLGRCHDNWNHDSERGVEKTEPKNLMFVVWLQPREQHTHIQTIIAENVWDGNWAFN